jgi:uroporphyrinogen decarboxylase
MSESMPLELMNDRFIKATRYESVDSTPIWLMRQAGRYLPEYMKTRAKAGSFLELAKNPSYASEVTLQPLDRYDLDAAILFSDILTIPDAMGLGLRFEQGEGPRFEFPLQTEKSIQDLRAADMDQLRYVFDAVTQIRKDLIQNGKQRVPLIGFSGSPWTLACYMIEGGGSKEFQQTKTLLYSRPDLMRRILDINIQSVTEYLKLQIESGAQAVMLFDTWGGLLSYSDYLTYSLDPMKEVIRRLHEDRHVKQNIPILLFSKGGGTWLKEMAKSGANVIGLDWTQSISQAREQLSSQRICLQGNLDPQILLGDQAIIKTRVAEMFNELALTKATQLELSPLDGHIFNLGHGISQFTPPENVEILISAIRAESKRHRHQRHFD